MRELLLERLGAILPAGWTLDAGALDEHRTREFVTVPGLLRLHRTLGAADDDSLATELLPSDGPVELLSRAEGHTLVRGMDATLGWTSDPLGELVEAPRIAASHGGGDAIGVELEGWLGAPYRLGGTQPTGIDCSALVQRCLRNALGVVTPRHSSDQLAFAAQSDPSRPETGDLLFVWTDRERPCHVGIVRGDSVVHASLSRKRVVADRVDELVRAAERVERIEWRAVVSAHAAFVGKTSITLPPRAHGSRSARNG
jgi:cell wall-associated NlpC family hydrolase